MNPLLPPDRRDVFAAIHAASQHLGYAGIKHWVDFGTLLGAVREGGYIGCDQDVDFNFFREDLPRLLGLRELFRALWRLELVFDPRCDTVRLLPQHPALDLTSDHAAHRSCIDAGIPYADLYPCWSDGKWLRHPCPEYDFRSIHPRRLKQVSFEGWPFPCPQNPRSLLRNRYGPDWRFPMDRQAFDSHAKALIEPFPDRLGCYVVLAGEVPRSELTDRIDRLLEDFDRVVIGIPVGAGPDVGRCWHSDTQVEIHQMKGTILTPERLREKEAHFCVAWGGVEAATPPVALSLIEADLLLETL